MPVGTTVLLILAAGLFSQWFAWRIRLPAIVILIASGFLLGPVTGLIEIGLPRSEVTSLIGLGVAIILFEGGMDLKLAEFRLVGHGIGRLTVLGPPIAWGLGAWCAHDLAGLSWPVSVVLGAILVVTGPTVITPLLRQTRLNKETASLLKWEGIVNDPIGVLLAVLAFQYFTGEARSLEETLVDLAAAIGAAAVLGGLGGWLTGWLFRRGKVPEHLKAPILMVVVLAAWWVSNLVQHEAGLLSVTVMGLVVGNMKLIEREALHRFKENLTIILVSVMFIVIPAQLEARQLGLLDWRTVAFVLAILLLVRPATVLLSTIGAPMRTEERLLLAWIAPRGIVAAATAGIFGPEMVANGYPDAEKLLPIVFLLIIVTVLAHGLSMGSVARRLGLAAGKANGLLIVGASPFSCALALALKKQGIDVLIADGAYQRLKDARMNGIDVYYGEILSEQAEHQLDVQHLSHLLCATDNDYYNALVCKAQARHFGHHRTFQLAIHDDSPKTPRRLTLQQRGHVAFSAEAHFESLQRAIDEGWTIQGTRLTESFDFAQFRDRLGEFGEAWLLLGAVTPAGDLLLYSSEQRFTAEAGWTLLSFSPPFRREPSI